MAKPPFDLEILDLPVVPYRYFDSETRGVDFAGMMEDLAEARSGGRNFVAWLLSQSNGRKFEHVAMARGC